MRQDKVTTAARTYGALAVAWILAPLRGLCFAYSIVKWHEYVCRGGNSFVEGDQKSKPRRMQTPDMEG